MTETPGNEEPLRKTHPAGGSHGKYEFLDGRRFRGAVQCLLESELRRELVPVGVQHRLQQLPVLGLPVQRVHLVERRLLTMRGFLRGRLPEGRRPARIVLCAGLAAGGLAALAIVVASLASGRPAPAHRTASQDRAGLFTINTQPCQGDPGPIGTVVRTIAGSSLAGQGIDFPVTALVRGTDTTLYVAPRGATLTPSHPASTQLGTVAVPSVHPAYRSCDYALQDNPQDLAFKAAAERAFASAGLATLAQMDGQGIIWMVADDPTSASDELVAIDIETPLTASSPGTIRTLVAAVDPSSATVLGVAATDW
jgi:hypothetical protein